MLLNNWTIAAIVGALIILALAFYAGRLLSQVKIQRKANEAAQAKIVAGQKAHDEKIMNSVLIIAKAMKEEQCDYSEGCWRLSVLLDSLKTSSELSEQFPAIFALYNKIKHMHILDGRKSLAKKERMKQDLERMKEEAALYDAINADLTLLLQYSQERLARLKAA
ncbi:MAG: DUF2489 domain-containing protein [Thalassotalea sp.]